MNETSVVDIKIEGLSEKDSYDEFRDVFQKNKKIVEKDLSEKGFKVDQINLEGIVNFTGNTVNLVAYYAVKMNEFDGWYYLCQSGQKFYAVWSDKPENIEDYRAFKEMPLSEKKKYLRMEFKKYANTILPDDNESTHKERYILLMLIKKTLMMPLKGFLNIKLQKKTFVSKSSSIALDLLLDATSNPRSNLEQNTHELVEGIDRMVASGTPVGEEDKKILIKFLGINGMEGCGGLTFFLLLLSGPLLSAIYGSFVWGILYFIHRVQYVHTLIVASAIINFFLAIMIGVGSSGPHIEDICIEKDGEKVFKVPILGVFKRKFTETVSVIQNKADIFALEKERKKEKPVETTSLDDFLNN